MKQKSHGGVHYVISGRASHESIMVHEMLINHCDSERVGTNSHCYNLSNYI